MTTALVSALTNKPVRGDIAMTGEITLRGRVLPIGGLKEKSMAAYSTGVKNVIMPNDNKSDLFNVDPVVKSAVEFHPVSTIQEVLKIALVDNNKSATATKSKPVKKHTDYAEQTVQ